MSLVLRVSITLGAIGLLAFAGLVAIGQLSGEVVVLHTRDESGAEHRTRLWIVEHEGASWLRAGGRATGSADSWYARLVAHPLVDLERGDQRFPYQAVLVPEARAAINSRMRESYPLADRVVRSIRGSYVSSEEDTSMPIRLDSQSSRLHHPQAARELIHVSTEINPRFVDHKHTAAQLALAAGPAGLLAFPLFRSIADTKAFPGRVQIAAVR